MPEQFPAECWLPPTRPSPSGPRLRPRDDRRDLPLVTLDPPGSPRPRPGRARRAPSRPATGSGTRSPTSPPSWPTGDAVDVEARRRGVTLYRPDRRTPLLPGGARRGRGQPAARRRPSGAAVAHRPRRRRRRSGPRVRAGHWCAAGRSSRTTPVQVELDAGRADGALVLLRTSRPAPPGARAGAGRGQPEPPRAAGRVAADGRYRLDVPGAAAGRGVERPDLAAHRHGGGPHHARRRGRAAADDAAARRRRRSPPSAAAPRTLGVPWPDGVRVRGVRARASTGRVRPGAALLNQAARALRGAGYRAFDGDAPDGDAARHFAVAAPVRPRDRPAAAAGRPLRQRGRGRAVRRARAAGRGAGRARRASRR